MNFRLSLTVVMAGLLYSGTAQAQEGSPIQIEGDVTIVSDYDYRGLSRTSGKLALQGGLAAFDENGLYGGFLLSSLNDDFMGYDAESELYIGYGFAAGAYDLDVSLSLDSLHQIGENQTGNTRHYGEIRGSIARDFGLAFIQLGAAYTPGNREYGLGQSAYSFAKVEVPLPLPQLPPSSLEFHVGYEAFEGVRDKLDWKVGLYMDLDIVEVGFKYYGTNRDSYAPASDSVVFSVRKYF